MLPRRSWDRKSFNHVAFVHHIASIVSPHNHLPVAEMEENKSSECSPQPCDDVSLSAKGELSEKSTTDREEDSLEKSKKEVKRTWREGSEEDQFRGLLTKSSRPEGPKAGLKGRKLEVGARRAPRLLVPHICHMQAGLKNYIFLPPPPLWW